MQTDKVSTLLQWTAILFRLFCPRRDSGSVRIAFAATANSRTASRRTKVQISLLSISLVWTYVHSSIRANGETRESHFTLLLVFAGLKLVDTRRNIVEP